MSCSASHVVLPLDLHSPSFVIVAFGNGDEVIAVQQSLAEERVEAELEAEWVAAYSIDVADLVQAEDGSPFEPQVGMRATKRGDQLAGFGECGRCAIPTTSPPAMISAGDACPIPAFAEGAVRVLDSMSHQPAFDRVDQLARDQILLRFPGQCGCRDFGPPIAVQRLELELVHGPADIAPLQAAIADDGTVATLTESISTLRLANGELRYIRAESAPARFEEATFLKGPSPRILATGDAQAGQAEQRWVALIDGNSTPTLLAIDGADGLSNLTLPDSPLTGPIRLLGTSRSAREIPVTADCELVGARLVCTQASVDLDSCADTVLLSGMQDVEVLDNGDEIGIDRHGNFFVRAAAGQKWVCAQAELAGLSGPYGRFRSFRARGRRIAGCACIGMEECSSDRVFVASGLIPEFERDVSGALVSPTIRLETTFEGFGGCVRGAIAVDSSIWVARTASAATVATHFSEDSRVDELLSDQLPGAVGVSELGESGNGWVLAVDSAGSLFRRPPNGRFERVEQQDFPGESLAVSHPDGAIVVTGTRLSRVERGPPVAVVGLPLELESPATLVALGPEGIWVALGAKLLKLDLDATAVLETRPLPLGDREQLQSMAAMFADRVAILTLGAQREPKVYLSTANGLETAEVRNDDPATSELESPPTGTYDMVTAAGGMAWIVGSAGIARLVAGPNGPALETFWASRLSSPAFDFLRTQAPWFQAASARCPDRVSIMTREDLEASPGRASTDSHGAWMTAECAGHLALCPHESFDSTSAAVPDGAEFASFSLDGPDGTSFVYSGSPGVRSATYYRLGAPPTRLPFASTRSAVRLDESSVLVVGPAGRQVVVRDVGSR
ncbi:MAG: hypothetical protein HYV07_16575 [Deltaproteobacteria bacterium]|nr:hypothetical protein [Deltaproteobacteria bacterium]